MKKMASSQTSYQLDDFVETDLQFYYSPEDLPCNNLATEDFDNANYVNYAFPKPLNEDTDNVVFSPNDILPGISFDLKLADDYDEYYYEWTYDDYVYHMTNYGFYLWDYGYYGYTNSLFSNYWFTDLVINFTGNNVTNVSMQVLNWNDTYVYIDVYDASDNLLGTDVVWVNYYYYNQGTFWGVQSETPIAKIILRSAYYYGHEGVDNVSFGICNDWDGDGVLNVNDAHPNSDMSEKINIGECNLNVDNKMVKNGTMMMDQVNDLIDQINEQYNGQNYTYLHKRFMTELAQITYRWRMSRLITATQRSQISSCAWGANIPHYLYPN
jgi:hypothetical protein